ncbi:hypothetical protein [Sphingomonas phage Kimi]|nr:hypothetical protein [Sphingomonas phage Kimi]
MAIKIENTGQLGMTSGAKCMVYGPAGVGKTRLLASAPYPIIISAERGLLSLRRFNIPVIQIKSLADLREAHTYVTGPNGRNIATVGLDSSSEIAEVCLTEQKKLTRDGRKAYGDAQDAMIDIFRSFRDIHGKNVVFLAKQEFTTDGATGAKYNAPSFPGNKLAQAAPYFFDEVFQLNNFTTPEGQKIWALRTAPDQYNVAKDRSGSLAEWENADPATGGGLAYLFQKMLNG